MNRNRRLCAVVLVIIVLAIAAGCVRPALGGVVGEAVEQAARAATRSAGREAVDAGVETLGGRIARLAARHGDEVANAVRRVGPAGLQAMEEAGEHAGQVARLLARYGDEALWLAAKPSRLALCAKHGDGAAAALLRHRSLAEPLIERYGRPAAKALGELSDRNARRLGLLAEDGTLQRIGRNHELLAVVGQYGNRAMEFVWRHKGALTVTAALAAFLSDPEAFISGARDVTAIMAENVARPVAAVPGAVAAEVARGTNWTAVLLVLAVLSAAVALGGLRSALRGARPRSP